MKRQKKAIIACFAVIAGLKLLAYSLPMELEGFEWRSIEKCAENQKNLYQSIESAMQKEGKLPDAKFQVNGFPAGAVWKCPACERGYALHLENYSNPRAVVIADPEERHPTTFMWWFRGLNPHVQTMGDGTIQLFKGGKILTMVCRQKRP